MMIKANTTPACSSSSMPVRTLNGSDPQEDRLIRQAQGGNLEAFNQLVLIHQDRVFRQALWILREEEAAEDASQESFLLAYRKLDTFRGGSFRPWLLQITTNYCLDQLRTAKRRPTQPLEVYSDEGDEIEADWIRDPGDSPEQALERSRLAEDITASMQRLAWGYRMPIILVDLQDLNYEEASSVMQIPIGTFKSRLARGRQKLCKELQNRDLCGTAF